MTTTFSVHKQNVNTYGPITSSYDPTTQKTTIPISSSDVTQSGSETQTSRAPSQQRKPERNNKRTTPEATTTTEHSVYTHKFPRHHFELTWPFDDEDDVSSPAPKSSKSQKESASEKKPQRVQNAKFSYEQGSASKTNSSKVPLYSDYSSAETQREPQTQSSNEEQEEEKQTERSKPQKSPFYDFFHSDDSGERVVETTPKPKRQQKPVKQEESDEHQEGQAKKAFFGGSKEDDKFEDIPNPFADPNFDFNGYLQELKASQAQHQQRAPNESNNQRRVIYANQAIPQNVYRPYRPYAIIPVQETTTLIPTTLNPYVDYQTTYAPDETIKQLETNPALPLVIRNALKSLNSPRVDQPYHSHTALKPVQAKPGAPAPYTPQGSPYAASIASPSYKSNDRGPQTFKNSHIIAYNVNTHKTAFKPGTSNNQKSPPKAQVKHVPVVATDDYYYYYYDDEPQQTQQVKAPSTNKKVEVVNKKPADDEYYYYEYYDYPEEKNKTKPSAPVRYEYVPPPKNNKPANKTPPRNPFTNPNSLPTQNHNTYKYPSDNTNYYTIKPVNNPLTTTSYPSYAAAFYSTARSVTTVQPTASRQRLTTTDGDSRHDQPNFYNR